MQEGDEEDEEEDVRRRREVSHIEEDRRKHRSIKGGIIHVTPITAAMIKELRERTGIGMGKCKEALEEAKGDMELAISNLRKAGMASAVKKEGRETNEGMIGTAENARRGHCRSECGNRLRCKKRSL